MTKVAEDGEGLCSIPQLKRSPLIPLWADRHEIIVLGGKILQF